MTTRAAMSSNRKIAIIVGALFLIAMATSLVGGTLIDSILGDAAQITDVSANETQVIIGVLLELTNGIAVVGIGVMMFPIFKKYDEALALGYVALRIIEAIIIIAAVISPLALVALSQETLTAGASEASTFQTVGSTLIAARANLVSQLLGIFFSLAALLLYYLLYQTKLVPRFISVWGLIAVASVLTWNLLEIFGVSVSFGMILALPIILNEIFLALWLIVKGFSSPALVPESAQASMSTTG